jgi:glycosyltransferase involved in cell wall biosynthesis
VPEPRVTVVVPAYREERLIAETIRRVPASVGEIIVVNDASTDRTEQISRDLGDPRVVVVNHPRNLGVGASIYTGYQAAFQGHGDYFVVMAGDNQMDQADLPALLAPLLDGSADYVKGNRLIHPEMGNMPRVRRWGSTVLAWFTSWASGERLHDTQCGYTAITRSASRVIPYSEMWSRYGYPNDLLIALVRRGIRVAERPVRPVYATEVSGLRPWHFFSILFVIARRAYLELRRSAARRDQAKPLQTFEEELRFAKK